MLYVTRGRIQVTVRPDKTEVWITPTQDYSIKHGGTNFIIFVETDAGDDVRKFSQEKGFHVAEMLINPCLNAAISNVCLEITIKDISKEDDYTPDERLYPFRIVAVKIPATLSVS